MKKHTLAVQRWSDRTPKTTKSLSVCWPLAVIVFSCALSGCAARQLDNLSQKDDGAILASFDANKRAIIILKNGEAAYVCPEPPPDVASEITKNFTAALDIAAGKFKADTNVANNVAQTFRQVSPTSEATTMLRSDLSQLCWIANNRQFTNEQTKNSVQFITDVSRRIAFREVALELTKELNVVTTKGGNEELAKEIMATIKMIVAASEYRVAEASSSPAASSTPVANSGLLVPPH